MGKASRDGFGFAPVPDWALRQRLDALNTEIAAATDGAPLRPPQTPDDTPGTTSK